MFRHLSSRVFLSFIMPQFLFLTAATRRCFLFVIFLLLGTVLKYFLSLQLTFFLLHSLPRLSCLPLLYTRPVSVSPCTLAEGLLCFFPVVNCFLGVLFRPMLVFCFHFFSQVKTFWQLLYTLSPLIYSLR